MKKPIILFTAAILAFANLVMGQGDLPEYSPNYLPFDEENWVLTSFDPFTGEGTLDFTGAVPPFVAGQTITTLANDTIGYFLRKITDFDQVDQKLLLQTEMVDMEDVFLNKSFILNTALMQPNMDDLRGLSPEELSKAFTDERGHIRPVEVIFHRQEGNRRIVEEKIDLVNDNRFFEKFRDDDYTWSIIDFYESLTGTELYASNNLSFEIEDGALSAELNIVMAFDFRGRDVGDDETEIIKDGELERIAFYVEGKARANADLKLTASWSYSHEVEEKEMVSTVLFPTVKFLVGPVPVWIAFELDVLANFNFDAEAELVATWGFDVEQTVRLGGEYLPPTNAFNRIAERELTTEFSPLEVTGEASIETRLEVFPRVSMFLYSAAGPYVDVVPYAEGNFHATAMVNSDGESDLKWNANIDLGLDLRAGLKPAFLESLLGEIGPYSYELQRYYIWKAPYKLGLITDLESSYIPPVTIPLQFRVSDNLDNRLIAPVFFNPSDGHIDKEWAISSLSGIAAVEWTIDIDEKNDDEIKTLNVQLLDTEDEVIREIDVHVHVNKKTTALYIKALNEGDSIVLLDMTFSNIEKGIFAVSENEAGLYVNGSEFYDNDLAISGEFGEMVVGGGTSFETCQTALQIKGKDHGSLKFWLDDATFKDISLNAVSLHGFSFDIRNATFDGCGTAIIAEGQRNRTFMGIRDATFLECDAAINIKRMNYSLLKNLDISRASFSGDHENYAISLTGIREAVVRNINITNYSDGIWGFSLGERSSIEKATIQNAVTGISLIMTSGVTLKENIIMNQSVPDNGPEEDDPNVGLFLRLANNNQIARNQFVNLCTAVRQTLSHGNVFSANDFQGCYCQNTGIRTSNSETKITNNNFESNAGAAVLFENATVRALANNNFINNDYGIVNLTPESPIDATSNYFSGQQSGDVDGNVNNLNILDDQVSLVSDFLSDTLFLNYGVTDSIGLHVQNFVLYADSVIVTVSDELGWISNKLVHHVALKDSLGTMIYSEITVPDYDPEKELQHAQMVWAVVESAYTGQISMDSVLVFVYEQVLHHMEIFPEMAAIAPGDSIQLAAYAFDQFGKPVETGFFWTASAGIVDQNGWLFTDPDFEGEIIIQAEDDHLGMTAFSYVMVSPEQPMLAAIAVDPEVVYLLPGESFVFQAAAYDQFGYPLPFTPAWDATGGQINSNGNYIAPAAVGNYEVFAIASENLYATAQVIVVDEIPFVPDAPMLVSPADGTEGLDEAPVLSWTNVDGAEHYLLEIFYDDGFLNQHFLETAYINSYYFNTIQPAISYDWRVSAVGTGGAGQPSEMWTFSAAESVFVCQDVLIQNFPDAIEDVCSGDAFIIDFDDVIAEHAAFYEWIIQPPEAGSVNENIFALDEDFPEGVVQITLLGHAFEHCGSASETLSFAVYPSLSVSVTIEADLLEVCDGDAVAFTATPVNGGDDPVYQWQVNGVDAGDGSYQYTYVPADGDEVLVVLTSGAECATGSPATSNTLIVNVSPLLPVSVTIEADLLEVCDGDAVAFTATPVNGGDDPVYQWQVNGVDAGDGSHQYTYVPADGDEVLVVLTSGAECATGSPATSNTLIVNVYEIPVVSWDEFEPSTLCVDWAPVLLYGGMPEGGDYSGNGVVDGYFDPGVAGFGAHEITYTYTSEHECGASAYYVLTVEACTDVAEIAGGESIIIYPNPAKNTVHIMLPEDSGFMMLYVFDNTGQMLSLLLLDDKQVELDVSRLKPGVYMLRFDSDSRIISKKLLIH